MFTSTCHITVKNVVILCQFNYYDENGYEKYYLDEYDPTKIDNSNIKSILK